MVDKIAEAFSDALGTESYIAIKKEYEAKQLTDKILGILNTIFSITIGIMMFLCFFSLTASMSANLYD